MVRYTILRLMIFLGALLLFWLVGLRSPDQQILLLALSAVVSMVLSFFLLRRERDAFSERIADRLTRRAERRRRAKSESDEEAEDAELDEPAH